MADHVLSLEHLLQVGRNGREQGIIILIPVAEDGMKMQWMRRKKDKAASTEVSMDRA